MMLAGSASACSSARSRLSTTASHCRVTAALASAFGPADLRGASLAHVVQVGQGPQPLVLELGDPRRLTGELGRLTGDGGSAAAGSGAGPVDVSVPRPGPGPLFSAASLIGLLTRSG